MTADPAVNVLGVTTAGAVGWVVCSDRSHVPTMHVHATRGLENHVRASLCCADLGVLLDPLSSFRTAALTGVVCNVCRPRRCVSKHTIEQGQGTVSVLLP